MACQRYQHWLTEAALGELSPEQRAELNAHLIGCEACREEFTREQKLVTAMDRSFSTLASAEPSSAMLSGLRTRIASQPHEILVWWRIAVPVLTLLVLFGIRIVRHFPFHRVPDSPQIASGAGTENKTPQTKPSESQKNAFHALATPNLMSHVPFRSLSRPVRASQQPEIIISRGQWAQLVTLRQQVQNGRVIAASSQEQPAKPAEQIEIESLSVKPLVFQPIVPLEDSTDESKNR
ncbi:MAG: anti-sigma factor family protein [Candidatus Acidiferrales bacterium]